MSKINSQRPWTVQSDQTSEHSRHSCYEYRALRSQDSAEQQSQMICTYHTEVTTIHSRPSTQIRALINLKNLKRLINS